MPASLKAVLRVFTLTRLGAEIIHETGYLAIVQEPLVKLSSRVCPTTCWTN